MLGPYKFYNGEVTLWFDVDKHIYYRELPVGMEPQDGVTTIIHIIDKSDALVPWASKQVYLRAMATIPFDPSTLLNEEGPCTYRMITSDIDEWLLKAKSAPRQIKEDAGDLGTLAHNCLEDSIREARRVRGINEEAVIVQNIINWPVDDRSVNCVKAAFDWMNQHNVRWLETERKVYSLKHRFAGTMDGLAIVDSCNNIKCKGCKGKQFTDVLSLIDWKSSNGLWVEYLYQTAAYQSAYEEELGVKVSDRWILRLGKEDGEFDPWRLGPEDYQQDLKAFLLCLQLTREHKAVKLRMKMFTKYRNKKS